MSSFGSQIRKRIEQLRRAGQDIPKVIDEVAEGATIEAVRVATQNTPVNDGAIRGTDAATGNMAQRWAVDSVTRPVNGVTYLKNSAQYASYVNDGHRMDKHFVPGLVANGNLLERIDPNEGGLMVGVRTTYVRGLYIKEKAVKAYQKTVKRDLDRRVRELFR